MNAQPRLVVSAPSSGHGKTAIAVGLLAAAAARGVTAAGFKVGPDHTDAAYLGLAAGRPGRNLDPRLVGAQRVAPLFAHGASGVQLAVIEGAMGLFDSLTGQPEIDGTAAVAATLRAPVVLVVDVAAMGHSIAALVHGFRMFDEMVHLGGVILNRIASPRHEQMLRTALDDIGMPVLGALRRGDLPNVLPARAHGPVPVAHRTVEASRAVRRLGEAVVGGLDLDRLIALANSAPALPGPLWTPAEALGAEPFEQRPVIALAGGPGAPYTYVETAELLTAAGADVAVVDPLRDETLPAGTRALVVGAGLPEGYAEELSANRRLCSTVAKFAADGWPVVAEGVALPWLGHEFDGRPMCGVLDATAYTGEQTVAGYREATAPTTSVLAPGGARITGYKQHRAIVSPRAGAVPAWTWSGGNPEGFVWRQVHASQLGLHWAAAPEIAKRVVAAAIAGPVSLQQPKPAPAPAPAAAMSSPPPAMPTVGAAPAPEMPSQVSAPDLAPQPAERVAARMDYRGAEFGPGFGPGGEQAFGGGFEPGVVVGTEPGFAQGAEPGAEPAFRPGAEPGFGPEPGPADPGRGLGERVAAEFGAVYGAHSNGIAVERTTPHQAGHAPGQEWPGSERAGSAPGEDWPAPGRDWPVPDQGRSAPIPGRPAADPSRPALDQDRVVLDQGRVVPDQGRPAAGLGRAAPDPSRPAPGQMRPALNPGRSVPDQGRPEVGQGRPDMGQGRADAGQIRPEPPAAAAGLPERRPGGGGPESVNLSDTVDITAP